jgi:ankyrin repeat protein
MLRRDPYFPARRVVVVLLTTACGFASTVAYAQSRDLARAAQDGDLAAVNALLRSGVDVNAGAGPGGPGTALMRACAVGRLEVVQALLAAKADVNAKGPGGVTALYRATLDGSLPVVQALLAAKADPSPQPLEKLGGTPLTVAFSQNHWDIARALLEAGANVNATDPDGVTALVLVARENSPRSLAMVQALLAAHADVNGTFHGGDTALGAASSTGSAEVVQALLAANSWVDVNIKQRDGRTPLMMAAAKGRADIVRLLLAAKADLAAQDASGKTALMLALENDHAEVAQLLMGAASAVPTQN